MARARTPSYTVAGATVLALVTYAKSRKIDLTDQLQRLGLQLEILATPESRVPVEAAESMWSTAMDRAGRDDFALQFAQCLDLDGFHVLGHLAASSATVGQAIERIVEFSRLLHDAGRTELERDRAGSIRLYPGCRGLPRQPPRAIAEFNMASAVILIRFVSGRPQWHPRAVQFHAPAPVDVRAHRALFGVLPSFGAVEDVIVLDEADLALPVRVSTPNRIGHYLESYARTLLDQLPSKELDLEARVRRAIVSSLSTGGLTIEAAAAQLSMTARTLQRRLAEEGASFSELIDEARSAAAEHYLRDESLTLGEISFLLGFNEPSTFYKAFRRWKGVPPGTWREKSHAAATP